MMSNLSAINLALDELENVLSTRNIEETRHKIAKVKKIIAHRQYLIRLADISEMGGDSLASSSLTR